MREQSPNTVRTVSLSSQAIEVHPFMFTPSASGRPKFWLEPVRIEYNHGFPPTELNKVATLVQERGSVSEAWDESSTAIETAIAKTVKVTADALVVDLRDGRTVSVPISWNPRLA